MAHPAAGAFEKPGGVIQFSAVEEPDVDVRLEDVDVREGRVAHARGGTSVVHHLTHVIAALAHAVEPLASDGAKLRLSLVQPFVDGWTAPYSAIEPKEAVRSHGHITEVKAEYNFALYMLCSWEAAL